MNTEPIEIINKIFDDRITYHMNMVKKHNDKISQLQEKRLLAIKETMNEVNELSKDNLTRNINYCPDTDDKLFDELHKQGLQLDSNLDDQDMIWDRIRQSQLGHDPFQPLRQIQEKEEEEEQEKEQKGIRENNLCVEPEILENVNITPDLLTDDTQKTEERGELSGPPINALYRINPIQRRTVIKDIFNTATENITKLAELDNKYKDNFDVEVQKEADRLLEVYLQTH